MSVTAVPVKPATNARMWLWLGIVLALALALGLAWVGTRAAAATKGDDTQYLSWNKSRWGVKTTASGLQYQVLEAGDGPTAQDGDQANVQIEGRLRDDTIFQPKAGGPFPVQSFDPARPVAIPGFLEALKLMKKGSKYRVWLPAKIAYDAIPGGGPPELRGKMLIFDIELTSITTAAEVQLQQQEQMRQQQAMQAQLEAQAGGNEAAPAEDAPAEAAKPKKK